MIEHDIRAALDAAGFRDVAIETMLSPPWTTDWISEAGKAKLHAYGIAPPSGAAMEACGSCPNKSRDGRVWRRQVPAPNFFSQPTYPAFSASDVLVGGSFTVLPFS